MKTSYLPAAIILILIIIMFWIGDNGIQLALWANVWVNLVFYLFAAASVLFFLSIHKLSTARWYKSIEYITLGFIKNILVFSVLVVLFLTFTVLLKGSMLSEIAKMFEANVAGFKLNSLSIRSWIYVGVLLLPVLMLSNSRFQKPVGKTYFVFYTLIYLLFITITSTEWLMSFHKDWHSSLFPWYILSSGLTCSVAVIILTVVFEIGNGAIDKNVLKNLGNYLFAFTCFWAYLWFNQYLLMWYGNLPEETGFILILKQHYLAGNIVQITGGFVIPFVLLLSPYFRKNKTVLTISAVSVFFAHWTGFYLIVIAGVFPAGHSFSAIEAISGILFLALFGFTAWLGIRKMKTFNID